MVAELFLSGLPLFLLLGLILVVRLPVYKASFLAMLCSAAVAYYFFGASYFGIEVDIKKGLISSLNVLYVVWTAILFHSLCVQLKVVNCIRDYITSFSNNQFINILFVSVGITSFFQGITGFGVPIVIGAPLLYSMGLRPLWALIFSIIGHTWANTYGTLALAWNMMLIQSQEITAINLSNLTLIAGIFLWLFVTFSLLVLSWWLGRFQAIISNLIIIIGLSCILGGGQLFFSFYVAEIAVFVPALFAMLFLYFIGKISFFNTINFKLNSAVFYNTQKVQTRLVSEPYLIYPYIVLVIISLLIILVPSFNTFFSSIKFSWSIPETQTALGFTNEAIASFGNISPFAHAGAYLFFTILIMLCISLLTNKICCKTFAELCINTFLKSCPISVAIISLLIMANIMNGSGQIYALATNTAKIFGISYTFFAPFIGMIGSLITGSNMASNILFTHFQESNAIFIYTSVPLILAGQTVGGAIGCTLSPGNILLGAQSMGERGIEQKIIAYLFPVSCFCSIIIGFIMLLK